MKGSVACDAIAASSGVSVAEDGTVTGLTVPLKLSADEAWPLLDRRGDAFLRFVGEKAAEDLVASYMHVISLISVVPSVPSIVLMVIPAPHGKVSQNVNDSLLRVATVMQGAGFDVVCVCTDGDSTYGANAQQACAQVQNPQDYVFHLPIDEQAGVWSGMCVPETTVVHCFDIDHQGKHVRYAVAKGHALVVFASITVGGREINVDRGTLLFHGVAASCLSDAAAGKMDDVLAAKIVLWETLYSAPRSTRRGSGGYGSVLSARPSGSMWSMGL
jgi:hypothetical protein